MDCYDYTDYRTGARAAAPPAYCAPYGRYLPHQAAANFATGAYPHFYGEMYAHDGSGGHLGQSQHLQQHQQQRQYEAYHHMQHVRHQGYPHAAPSEYMYGGKESRSRRGIRERERERPRQPYHSHRWMNGYGEEMHPYMQDGEAAHSNWNYYQGGSWANDRDMYMNRGMNAGYGAPSPMMHQPHQPYRQDPLRGMAAMQANSGHHMDDKMSMMNEPRLAGVQPTSCCASYSNDCTCPPIPKPSPHPEILPDAYRQRQTQTPAPKFRPREEPKAYAERTRRNKSPKIKQEEIQPPTEPKVESVPLPAFQQAFGSTEIGRFSGAFVRPEAEASSERSITEEMVRDAIWNQIGEGLCDEWKDQSVVQLDACFETLPPGPTPVWSHAPAPTPAHHIY